MSRLVIAVSGLVAAAMLVMMQSTPVSADCATDGWGTPAPREARSIVFSGVIEGATSVPSDGGPPTRWSGYLMRVERVYHGTVPSKHVALIPLCANVNLDAGKRYVIGNSASTHREDWLMLNDQTSIAWEVLSDGRVQVLSFGVPVPQIPEVYRRPQTMGDVVSLLAPSWTGSLPPTDQAATAGVGTLRPSVLLLVVGALSFFGALIRLRRRPWSVTS